MDIHDLFERRSNPDVNTGMRSRDIVKQIEPFMGRHDAYLSMVQVEKVGIHPSSGHDTTPTAIYAYPLSQPEIMRQFSDQSLPYMGWAKHAAVIITKPGLRKLSDKMDVSESEAVSEQLDRLMGQVITRAVWEDLKRLALNRSRSTAHYGILYNDTYAAATVLTTRMDYQGEMDIFDEFEGEDFLDQMKVSSKTRPRVWNSLLRRLGFDAVEDHGTGFIFSIEPFQTAFLHKGCIAHYELFRNGRSKVYGHGMNIESAGHLFRLIRDGKMNVTDSMAFLDCIMRKAEQPSVSRECPFAGYNSNIILTNAQVRETVKFLRSKDDAAVDAWVASHSVVRDPRSVVGALRSPTL